MLAVVKGVIHNVKQTILRWETKVNDLSICPHSAKLEIQTGSQASITRLNLNRRFKHSCLLDTLTNGCYHLLERGYTWKCVLSFCRYSYTCWDANLEAHLTGNTALSRDDAAILPQLEDLCLYTAARAAPSALRMLSAASGKIPTTEPPGPEPWPKLETNLNHSTGTN